MIIFREKLFTRLNGPEDVLKYESEGIGMEIIKTCRMYQSGINKSGVGDQNIQHWIYEELERRYLSNIFRYNLLYSDAFGRIETKQSNNKTLEGRYKTRWVNLNYSMGKDFIIDCIKKAEKGNKYIDYFEGNNLHNNKEEIEFFLRLFKYIALSLSGQINPDIIGFWDKKIDKTIINFGNKKEQSKQTTAEGRRLICKCIVNGLMEGKGVLKEDISPVLFELTKE